MKATLCSLAAVAAVLAFCKFSAAQTQEPSRDGLPLNEWIRRTGDASPNTRQYAANVIHDMGPEAKAAVPALIKLLHDKDSDSRDAAAKALGAMRSAAKAAVPALINALDDPESYVRHVAAESLGQIGPDAKSAAPDLVKMLRSVWRRDRCLAARTLGKINPDANVAAGPLAEAAVDDYGEVREAAIAALIGLGAGAKLAVPVLVNRLHADVGAEAKPAVPVLVKRLHAGERSCALTALAKLGPLAKDAIPEMAKMLTDNNLELVAFEALTDLGPVSGPVLPQLIAFDRKIGSWQQWDDKKLSRKECVEYISQRMTYGRHGGLTGADRLWNVLGVEDLPFIAPMLKSETTSERDLAVDKFLALGPAAVPALVQLLKDDDPGNRRTAIRLLGHVGPDAKNAVPALAPILKDSDWQLRSAAAIALGEIGPDAAPAVVALRESLTDTDGDVRVCAIEALGRIGTAAAPAIAGLIERLHDTSPAVRSAAARALGQIGPGAKAALPELEKLSRDREDYVRQAAGEVVDAISAADAGKNR
jgi:HEAT repeat protein